jgi:hypothetical protein
VIGLVIGFVPVLGMLLHNWFFGGAFYLFTATAQHPGALVTPPWVYLAAIGELSRFDFSGQHISRAAHQIGGWLAGPSEWVAMAPLNAAALVVLIRMLLRQGTDPWLRLIAGANLAQQTVGMFYAPAGRYYYLTWFLTGLVTSVWFYEETLPAFRKRFPVIGERVAADAAVRAVACAVASAAAAAVSESHVGRRA